MLSQPSYASIPIHVCNWRQRINRISIAVLEELVPSDDVEIAELSPNGQVIEEEEEVLSEEKS